MSGSERPLPLVAGARVTGARHLRAERLCQDAVRVRATDRCAAIAVADGHGSAAKSDVGAELAVTVAIEALERFAAGLGPERSAVVRAVHAYAEHPLRVQITRAWTERVREDAGAADADLAPYGSTLIFALATQTYVLLGQIGDGDILLVDPERGVSRPIPPDPRCFAEETMSLCQREAWTELRVLALPPPEGEALLLLSTDGYGKSYASDADFEKIGPDYLALVHAEGLRAVEAQLGEFLAEVTQRGSGDDIALGMMYWPPPGARGDGEGRVER